MTADKKEPAYLAMIRAENKYYLLANDSDGTIVAFDTLETATNFFEKGYEESHARSYEASMSACINYIFFNPSIIKLEDKEDIVNTVIVFPIKMVRLTHVAGNVNALPCEGPDAEAWFEAGIKPRLIHNGEPIGQMDLPGIE